MGITSVSKRISRSREAGEIVFRVVDGVKTTADAIQRHRHPRSMLRHYLYDLIISFYNKPCLHAFRSVPQNCFVEAVPALRSSSRHPSASRPSVFIHLKHKQLFPWHRFLSLSISDQTVALALAVFHHEPYSQPDTSSRPSVTPTPTLSSLVRINCSISF